MSNQTPIKAITQKEISAMIERLNENSRPPIRNYTSNPKAPAIRTADLLNDHNPLAIDVSIENPEAKRKQRSLTAEECYQMFGASTAVKMNFVPQMLTALMLQEVTQLVNYCRVHKVSDVKKQMRVLRKCVEEYVQRLAEAYGGKFVAYAHYSTRFLENSAGDVMLMEMQADVLCRNQLPDVKHREIASRALIILMLITFIQNYDRQMDKLIASKMGLPVHQKPDIYHEMIKTMCIVIGEAFGYKMEPDEHMANWMRVLSNRAALMADTILGEEAT